MSFRLAVATAVLALAAAGCVAPNAAVDTASTAALGDLLSTPESLYLDPENAPHPKFNWPTLVNPAASAQVPAFWKPIPALELPETITGISHLVNVGEDVPIGGGISIFGSLAVVPGLGDTSFLVDISDPSAPVKIADLPAEQAGHRGSAIIAYPDGKLAAVFATGAGFEVYDITDPTKPVIASATEPTNGGHKIGVVPGTPYVYNAASNGGANPTSFFPEDGEGITEIYDLTDPYKPRHVQDFPNGFGCHHIYFWQNAEKQRAICAGIEFAQIWDIADPENPEIIVSVPIPHGNPMLPSLTPVPLAPFAHFSILNDDGTVLIVGDELGGGSLPPGCTAGASTPARDASPPTGALWFYDVSDETDPQVLGWYSPGHHLEPDNLMASCTAHHGRLVPDEERDLLAMSFYGAGVVLVDFTDPMNPWMVDQFKDGSNTWETWYYNGYLFTGDINRGMDILTFE